MAVPQHAPQHAPPSPVIPIIVLLILGTMMTIPSLTAYDPNYWNAQVAEVQTHFIVGAFLIPVCVLLLVQAFGIPKVNPGGPRTPSPLVDSLTQNLTSSILLVVVIIVLLMLVPLRSSLQGPWQPTSPYARSRW